MAKILMLLKSPYKVFLSDSRVRRHAEALHKGGHNVTVLLVDEEDKPLEAPEGYALDYVRVPGFWKTDGTSRIKKLINQISYYSRGKKHIKNHHPDILYLNDINTLPFSKSRAGCVIYDSHELWYSTLSYHKIIKGIFYEKMFLRFEKRNIRHVSRTITVNDSLARIMIRRYGLENVSVIRNIPQMNNDPIVSDIRKYADLPSNQFVIVHVGSLHFNRGLKEFIGIINLLHRDNRTDISLIFFGIDDEIRDIFNEKCTEEELAAHRFFESIPIKKLYGLISAADIGLVLIKNTHLSYYYSLPNKFFESLLNGLPVICSDFPEMKKIIDEHKVGWLVDPDNVDEIYGRVLEINENRDLILERKEHIDTMKGKINWNTEKELLLNLPHELLNDS